MADITKVSGVLFESISKVGPTLKSSISKINGKTTPPAITCVEYTFIYATAQRDICSARETSTYFHDETSGTLYSESCGGTEAEVGYYRDDDGYREYTGGSLSGVLGTCRSDRRLKQNILFKQYSKSGIPIYEFQYINESDGIGTYVGTMAQDLIKLGKQEAVTMDSDGYYSVYYDKIDVDFRKV
jgi:hypothetical protein